MLHGENYVPYILINVINYKSSNSDNDVEDKMYTPTITVTLNRKAEAAYN